MDGWELNSSFWRNFWLFTVILCLIVGFFGGWYAGTHRCPQEDSCGYSNHQWQPEDH